MGGLGERVEGAELLDAVVGFERSQVAGQPLGAAAHDVQTRRRFGEEGRADLGAEPLPRRVGDDQVGRVGRVLEHLFGGSRLDAEESGALGMGLAGDHFREPTLEERGGDAGTRVEVERQGAPRLADQCVVERTRDDGVGLHEAERSDLGGDVAEGDLKDVVTADGLGAGASPGVALRRLDAHRDTRREGHGLRERCGDLGGRSSEHQGGEDALPVGLEPDVAKQSIAARLVEGCHPLLGGDARELVGGRGDAGVVDEAAPHVGVMVSAPTEAPQPQGAFAAERDALGAVAVAELGTGRLDACDVQTEAGELASLDRALVVLRRGHQGATGAATAAFAMARAGSGSAPSAWFEDLEGGREGRVLPDMLDARPHPLAGERAGDACLPTPSQAVDGEGVDVELGLLSMTESSLGAHGGLMVARAGLRKPVCERAPVQASCVGRMSLVSLRSKSKGSARPRLASQFLPTTRREMEARGWDQLDILLVNGDAYVDHPAFGAALIGRFLEARGYRVGVVSQPRWDDISEVSEMGTPRLFVGITAGNLDSMLNKLTAQKKVRSDDQYSPGGQTGKRPNRASVVYGNLCRQAFSGVPIVLGGIEASLRRIAHYDYWSDSIRRSVLLDSKADLLIFGMGERPVWEVADRLAAGQTLEGLRDVRGTAHVLRKGEWEHIEESRFIRDGKPIFLPSHAEVKTDVAAFSRMSGAFQKETNPGNGRPILQVHDHEAVYLNPPAEPLDTALMDELYDLPFARAPHPDYDAPIPAFETVKHSIVTMRGCFGGCSFCSITEHEGRVIQSRSAESVLREVRSLRRMGDFRGVISDVGGPTANMYQMKCKSETIEKACRRLSCVHPGVCENLVTDHAPLVSLLKKVREEDGVRKVFIASGVRYDLAERSPEFVKELAAHHTGGQLSVAPEHVDDDVLDKMKKPGAESYERFADMFACASEESGRDQHLVPYYISGHPGSTLESMVKLALYLKKRGLRPRQVQDFIPTPMSMATSMYVTGLDPFSQEPVYTARSLREKRLQKALLQYWDPAQHDLAREALQKCGRADLIGSQDRHLVPPASGKGSLSIHDKRRQKSQAGGRAGRTGRRGAGIKRSN